MIHDLRQIRICGRFLGIAGCVLSTLLLITPRGTRSATPPQQRPGATVEHADAANSEQPAAEPVFWPKAKSLVDSNGKPQALDSLRGPRGVVVVFLSTECPISRAYVPSLNDLHGQRQDSGIAILGVEANEGRTAAEVAEHIREFSIAFPVFLDPDQAFANLLKIETCPTAVFFDAQGQRRYFGRVDDRFTRRGGAAATPKNRELSEAMASVAAGKPPTVAHTEPLGCPLRRGSNPENPASASRSNTTTGSVNFDERAWSNLHREALSILRTRCGECHRDGGIGPMDLRSESTALAWADDVVKFTQDGSMPPWKPVPGWGEFQNSRKMPADEIEKLRQWGMAAAKRPEPNRSSAPVRNPAPTRSPAVSATNPETPPAIAKVGPDLNSKEAATQNTAARNTAAGNSAAGNSAAANSAASNSAAANSAASKTAAGKTAANTATANSAGSNAAPAAMEVHLPPRPDWRLGPPDLILEPESTYVLGADGPDEYRCFVFPTNFAEDRFVRVFEIQPGNSRVVHHVLTFIDTRKAARKLDQAEPTAGYLTEGGWPGFMPSGTMGGWAPGNVPSPLPEGTVRVLPAGADLVMQVHYHRSGKPEPDRTRIGLYFAKTPPERAVRMMPVMLPGGPLSGLRIPANEPRHRREAEMTLPIEIDALAVTPHMHLLGREVSLEAFLPDGTTRKMVKIDRWDFNWQETYRFVEPVRLPKGTRLRMELTWDNSADNPSNPHQPPQEVRWGEQTTEEMGMVFLETASTKRATDPSQVRAPTPDEQIRFYIESQADNRKAGKVTLQFELVLRAMELKLRAFDRGLVPSLDGLAIP
ncbi:MAG: hypothetical protein RLY70_2722 [Planctomycetota bacterium]